MYKRGSWPDSDTVVYDLGRVEGYGGHVDISGVENSVAGHSDTDTHTVGVRFLWPDFAHNLYVGKIFLSPDQNTKVFDNSEGIGALDLLTLGPFVALSNALVYVVHIVGV